MKYVTPVLLSLALVAPPALAQEPPVTAAAPPAVTAPPPSAALASPTAATPPVTVAAPEPSAAPGLRVEAGPWAFRPFGYLRLGYENVQNDERYEFVGRTDGFVLDAARLGIEVQRGDELAMVISVDGAAGRPAGLDTPQGTLDVNLRDAYARYDPIEQVGVQVGQFTAPFAAEEMRSHEHLLFATRALGQEGVLSGRGLEQPALAIDRQVGVMISQKRPLRIGDFGVASYAMLANGNGQNQLLDDNAKPAFIGRVELYFRDLVRAGGAFMHNDRRVGTPPDLLDERDVGLAGDLLVTLGGLEVFGQFVQIMTEHKTVGAGDRTQRAISAQAGYRIELPPYVDITPGYRFAQLDPWVAGDEVLDGAQLDTFALDYHTVGVRLEHAKLPLQLFVNYTFTIERAPHELDNNRLQIMTQAGF